MTDIIKEKAAALTMDQFVQEMVLGKIASDIYNESKQVAPLRHVGIRKSKLLSAPSNAAEMILAAGAASTVEEVEEVEAEEEEVEEAADVAAEQVADEEE